LRRDGRPGCPSLSACYILLLAFVPPSAKMGVPGHAATSSGAIMACSPLLCCTVCLASLVSLLPPARAADEVGGRAQALLKKHCVACHGTSGAGKGGFDYVLDRDRLVARGLVIPGSAGESLLFQRVRDQAMPPGRRPPLAREEVA